MPRKNPNRRCIYKGWDDLALDGALLSKLKTEIEQQAVGARIDKIYQPSREELVFAMRGNAGSRKLLFCAKGSAPRVHFTDFAPENPATPPMFCMLLRKMLIGARLQRIEQYGLDRVLCFTFEALGELGDRIFPQLVVEIMGGRSNLILVGGDGRIVDAVRRTDLEKGGSHMIQPGLTYHPPEPQDKVNILSDGSAEILRRIRGLPEEKLSCALAKIMEGACPLICRELAYQSCRSADLTVGSMTREQYDRLEIFIGRLTETIRSGGVPTLVSGRDGIPFDFTYMPVSQYGSAAVTAERASYSALLDSFYAERERADRMKHKSAGLLKLITVISSRLSRKLDAQRRDLAKCAHREKFRIFGELIKANLHIIPKGASAAVVQNYYDPDLAEVKIPLNSAISPAANAQKYFKDYKKSYTAEQTLTRLIAEGERELVYLDSVFDALSRAASDADLADIREELENGGYLKTAPGRRKAERPTKPMAFVSSDGFQIFVGRNNKQNDQLTLRQARRDDLWLHVKNFAGSHVIVAAEGCDIPNRTVTEAAVLAAYYSKARESSAVPVDYTPVKNVKKPAGAKPGMVIYETNQTIYVTPDKEKVLPMLAVPGNVPG